MRAAVVFNAAMLHRVGPAVAALVLALAVVAPPALARVIEIGATDASPSCPKDPCLAVTRTTGYQAKVGSARGRFTVPADGRIVAWSVALGKPTKRQIAYFFKHYGGAAAAQLTVLRPGRRQFARVMGQTPLLKLQRYFGQTVQFPLVRTLAVRQGDVIALTVPTWAPALTHVMHDGSAWRASRTLRACTDRTTQTAQRQVKDGARYLCGYPARLTYSATLITQPHP